MILLLLSDVQTAAFIQNLHVLLQDGATKDKKCGDVFLFILYFFKTKSQTSLRGSVGSETSQEEIKQVKSDKYQKYTIIISIS